MFTVRDQKKLSGKLLLVDDEESIRDILSYNLVVLGLEVDVAEDGVQGFDMISATEYDYVITDLKMPRMNGEELLKRAKQLFPDYKTRYIVITAGIITSYSKEDRDMIRQLADGYITKPFDRVKLRQVLLEASGKNE
ncbi:MAG: response regulator [Oligoflexia bacterium]|nr:response regulator [Oligoflexia bacterium]